MKANKVLIIRLIIATIFWIVGIILQFSLDNNLTNEIIYLSFYIVAYIISGYDILIGAVKHIFQGEFLDEYFLMSIATIGAFVLRIFGEAEYLEAVAVMIFFQVGELFQGIAVQRSKNAIVETMKLDVDKTMLEDGTEIDSKDVMVGSTIIVKPGQMVPLDGKALNDGIVNQASLTGEAKDVEIASGDMILSGSINQNKPLKILVTKEYFDSTAYKIIDMVENATMRKAKSEKFITKFARIYTPIVVIFALLLAIVPPVIIGLINGFTANIWNSYIYAALTCLVVSCPCALVVSVPLTYFAGIGAAAKNKIIIKGGTYLEDLALVNKVVMDKTGTITKATFVVADIIGDDKNEIIKIAKGLEKTSTHPLALAINKCEGEAYDMEVEETPGYGISGKLGKDTYLCGSKKLMNKNNIEIPEIEDIGSILYLAKNNSFLGAIVLVDEIKDEASFAINELKKLDNEIIVLSGDTKSCVDRACSKLGISNYHAGLLPNDKVKIVDDIINTEDKNKVIFIGDGINDAPVLALADVGVSMGQIGSDAAVEASDVVVLNDDLKAIPKMIKISKKTRRIVIQNIIFTLLVKVLILGLCAISNIGAIRFKLPMWLAIFGDVGVCVLAVFNSMRALQYKD